MRWTFKTALHDMMWRDERIVLLWCDVGLSLWKDHRRDFSSRVINVGICEQATVSMAAGMAMAGMRPIVYSITPFIIERAFEQVKIDIDQQNLPVGLIGHSNGECGPTHRELDAPVLMGLCRNIKKVFPSAKEKIPGIMEHIDRERPWFLGLHEK